MKLTWTFYPKNEPSISLEVNYVPELDGKDLEGGGFLHISTNRAFVNWITFRRFDEASVKSRKDAFARLIRISDPDPNWIVQRQVN
ncbi:hypothetical protein [Spirosoma panaciterrae]|uniref:hypothetical protein n=1 Tax=Spirosoma panaciterrae TaxID=496058 RepID=UPI00035C9709|nr:hypothetical protein [Spirosoma panaciterrae]